MDEWSRNKVDRVAETWKNLSDAFGPRFLRDYGNVAPPIWADAIRSLKPHEIARGFRRLALHGSASSPTLPQFMKACKTVGEMTDQRGNVLVEGDAPRPNLQRLPNKQETDLYQQWGQSSIAKFLVRPNVRILSDDELAGLRTVRDRLVAQYREIGREETVMQDEFLKAAFKAYARAIAA